MLKKIESYVVGILIPVAVGLFAAFLTRGNMDIYSGIEKPISAPPAILFPIVWSILYVLMGISSVFVYNSNKYEKDKKSALKVYAFQLAVNFFWSIIFFNLQAILFSFVWLILLLFLIVLMTVRFFKINKPAAYLQIPYIIWVSFAGYLNFMIYLLNG